MKRTTQKWLSFLLALVLLITMMPLSAMLAGSVSDYDSFIKNLKVLEQYADEYATATYRKDSGELVLNFIRTGVDRYQDDSWSTIAGAEITGFTQYVEDQDEKNGTTAMDLRDIVTDNFRLPNGDLVDFGHMFGTMNISYVAPGSADLSGWAGDLCDLLYYCARDTQIPSGTVDQMAEYILEQCFGVDASDAFGWDDFYGDMDGYYLTREYKKGEKPLSQLMEEYFTPTLSDVDRSVYFVNNRFAVEDSKEAVRKAIYDSYFADVSIKMLESSRGLTSYNNLRQACCYALADYLYSKAAGQLVPGTNDDTATDNDYYSVFSTESSILAPGITQDIKYAQTADGKQIVYYVATVDVNRDDVTIMANYKDNDPSLGWGYQRVADQAAALVKNYKNKYENFNVIVATNADGYNMSTGEPGGLLIMDGKEWHAVDKDGFFAILKDGSAMIGTQADYETYKDQIRDAVGGFGAVLVKEGKINVTKNANYTATRASRTAVGIKADGSVVMMVLDGRQLPFSAGGAMEEIAQIMLDAGCVEAINLDGGGSTTYLSKPAGSDTLQLTNRPSDGYARSVSTSLVAVSTAKSSNEFDHAIISSDYEYITAGTSIQIGVTGVSNTGNAAIIPDGAYWRVSDAGIGSVDENGVFTAINNGDVTVEFVVNGVVEGSKELHVVVPDAINFAQDRITAIYGVPIELSLTLWYEGNPVAFNTDTDVIIALLESEDAEISAGIIDGLTFTGNEESGIRSVRVVGVLLSNTEVGAVATINLYKKDEATFDFDNATAGNRTLAWNREVTNARSADNLLYRIVNPNEDITIDYTFALDMTTIEIPPQLEPLKGMLPGADAENASAWNFLLQLAERVCELTTVTITADFSTNLDVDISGLEIVTEYFELESAKIDENNRLTVTIKWIDQTAAIDAATANSLCILNGIKATVKQDAAYNNNELLISNNGHVSYDIYLAASQLYSFATNPMNNAQEVYGLYPYEHSPACRTDGNDKGAHFASTYTDFADVYVINSQVRKGWIEDSYYVDNQEVTGIQFIPSRENINKKYFYEFDDKGVLVKALSGLIEYKGDLYYAMNGEPQIRWQSLTDENGNQVYYYFDPVTYKAVDGEQKINEGIIFTYTFENHILVKGDLRPHSYTDKSGVTHTGIGYRWAGSWMQGQWFQYEGKDYYLPKYTYVVATGLQQWNSDAQAVPAWGYYLFDENGVFLNDRPRIYNDIYFEDGMAITYSTRIVEVDGYYYLVNGQTLKIVKDSSNYINDVVARGYVAVGTYYFDATGKLVKPLVTVETSLTDVEYTVMGRAVNVKSDLACRIGYLVDGKYVSAEVIANADGSYTFSIPASVAEGSTVLLVLAGDVSGDGKVDADDQQKLAAALLPSDYAGAVELTPEQLLAADVNGNGVFNSADRALIARSLLSEDHPMYQPLPW